MFNRDNKKPKINKKVSGNIFIRTWYAFKTLSFIKHIFIFYFIITLIGSILLWGSFTHNAGNDISYTNALFTSASAFSDTGLTTVTTAETYNAIGQAFIAILILVGGIGWFALKAYFFNILLGKPISLATREALATERGSVQIGVTRSLIKIVVTILFIIIAIFSVILSIYFYCATPVPVVHSGLTHADAMQNSFVNGQSPKGNWELSIRYGIFHSISAINNAGFDIMGGSSIGGYYGNYSLQIIFIFLFVLGGVGYPVIYDTYKWVKGKFIGKKHKWSLFSKISMSAYLIIVIVGLIIAFSIELNTKDKIYYDTTSDGILTPDSDGKPSRVLHSFWNNSDYGANGDKVMAIFFHTMSTRNAGFSTVNMGEFSRGTLLLYSIMMFIGSAPSSTAGGIRTTTIAIVFLGLWSRIRGKGSVRVFNRRLPTSTVASSYIVLSTALILVLSGTLIAMTSLHSHGGLLNSLQNVDGQLKPVYNPVTHDQFGFTDLVFEVSSAFGTTGLSVGVTPHLSLATKLTLIFVMFVGQLGVSSSILVWSRNNSKSKHYKFVEENVPIG